MKLIRSTKCSLKFTTQKKKDELQIILREYAKVVNTFIDYFWLNPATATKGELLKPVVDLPETWLSARLRKVGCDHTDNADVNAGKNILNRFLTGQYGVCYKEINVIESTCRLC